MAKGLLAILGAPGSGGPEKGGPSSKGGGPPVAPKSDAKTMAAEDLIDAVQGGDAAAVATAFQRMYDACSIKGGGMGGTMSEEEEYE